MGEKKTTPISINDKEYILEDMTEQQQVMVSHCNDLDRKIRSAQFNLDQLSVGKDAFVKLLVEDLEASDPE
jgi:flagellar hook assembly protein FlgD